MKKSLFFIFFISRFLYSTNVDDPFPFLELPKDIRFVCFSMLIDPQNSATILQSVKKLGRLRNLNRLVRSDLMSHASNSSDTVDSPIVCITKYALDRAGFTSEGYSSLFYEDSSLLNEIVEGSSNTTEFIDIVLNLTGDDKRWPQLNEPDEHFCKLFDCALKLKSENCVQVLEEKIGEHNNSWVLPRLYSYLNKVRDLYIIHRHNSDHGHSSLTPEEITSAFIDSRRFIFSIAGDNIYELLTTQDDFGDNVLHRAIKTGDLGFVKDVIHAAGDKRSDLLKICSNEELTPLGSSLSAQDGFNLLRRLRNCENWTDLSVILKKKIRDKKILLRLVLEETSASMQKKPLTAFIIGLFALELYYKLGAYGALGTMGAYFSVNDPLATIFLVDRLFGIGELLIFPLGTPLELLRVLIGVAALQTLMAFLL
jgi:hypothetical protein